MHKMMRSTIAPFPQLTVPLLLGAALTACLDGGLEPTFLGGRDQAIVGGRPESGQPAVVALVDDNGAFCSGTLVRPAVVVTAAHCLEGMSASSMGAFFGEDANWLDSGTVIPAASIHAHPRFDGVELTNDIGVVTLEWAADVTPIDVMTTAMGSDWIGREVLFVGFGATSGSEEDGGVKLAADIPITEVDDSTFTYGARGLNTCFGDSGGPALGTDASGQWRLLGVTSWGDETCSEFGVDTRVDAYIDFLQPYLGSAAPPADGGDDDNDTAGDICAEEGWYDDGYCDTECLLPDPDCGTDAGDWCAEEGWYGDGWCDTECPNPDPDCDGSDEDGGDWCAEEGAYDDGWCDEDCANPDPDCEDDSEDIETEDDGTEDDENSEEDPEEWPIDFPSGGGCSVSGGQGGVSGLLVLLALVPLAIRRRSRK